jgi:outer membrane protein
VRFIVKRNVKILLAAALTGFASLASAQGKIGIINGDRLMQESPQFVAADAEIKSEFLPKQKEIQALEDLIKTRAEKLQRDGATMTEMQRTREEKDLQAKITESRRLQSNAQEDFNERKEEVMGRLQRQLQEEIAAFAKANGYDLILTSGVAYHAPAYDVTTQVLDAIKKKSAGAAAPAAAAPAAAKPPATAPAPKPATPAAKP